MASTELLCISALYLCLLLVTFDSLDFSLRQWYHLTAQMRVLAVLGVLCVLLSTLFQARADPLPRKEVKAYRKTEEDDLSVHSWVAEDFAYY